MLNDVFAQSLTITAFVFVMMVIVEYVNVSTRGGWDRILSKLTWGQSVVSALLGSVPGCLGAFAVCGFYMHRVITLGAVVAAMIATCGDEAFVMLAMFPERALPLFLILFGVGVVSGILTDLVLKGRRTARTSRIEAYEAAHPGEKACVPFVSLRVFVRQWRNCSPHRGWLALLLVFFLAGVITGHTGHHHVGVDYADTEIEHAEHHHDKHAAHGHGEKKAEHGRWGWVRITLLVLGLAGLFVVASVPDHFLDEHLWNHIARVHIWRIFLWTIGALVVTRALLVWIDIGDIISAHKFPVLLFACVVGIIPESGSHLVFVTLYANGAIPFSTLLAGSIVQDGHGMLPLLAHSRRAYFGIKAINFVVGLLVGIIGHAMGW